MSDSSRYAIRGDDLYTFIVYTVRYAVTRSTTAACEASELVRRYAHWLTSAHLAVVRRDLANAIDNGFLFECDDRTWRDLALWLDEHIKERTR